MGSFLDSAKKIRERQKNPSRKAHLKEKKLEKDKNKGVNNGKKRKKAGSKA